jgi:hypothetical protein
MAGPKEASSYPDGNKYPESDRSGEMKESGVPSQRKPQPQPTSGEI